MCSLSSKVVFGVVVVCVFGSAALGQPWDGNGVEGDPYLIYTAADMQGIGADPNYWDAHFELMVDIDLSAYTGTSYNIIGNSVNRFTGVFDGNGHSISNFEYSSTGLKYIGLFGYVRGADSEIRTLGVIDANVDGGTGSYVGSLVGYLRGGTVVGCYAEDANVQGAGNIGGLVGRSEYSATISNCYCTGEVVGTGWDVGGLVGKNDFRAIISNSYSMATVSGNKDVGGLVGYMGNHVTGCFATGSVTGESYVGGLAGWNNGRVAGCYATGSVVSTDEYAGGLIGWNDIDSILSDSYARGAVTGKNPVGGLAGLNWGKITNCYSTGIVTGTGFVGGLVGEHDDSPAFASYFGCFWNSTVNPSLPGIGNGSDPNVVGESTVNMQTKSTFVNAGWDFVDDSNGCSDIWAEPNGGGYPILWFQLYPLPPLPSFSGGTGTQENPFLISTDEQLDSLEHNPRLMNAHFRLTNDIDLAGVDFGLIAVEEWPFTGEFDGNNHVIRNFTWVSTGIDQIGLFRYVYDGSEIRDVGLEDVNVDGGDGNYVGGLIGYARGGVISSCYCTGSVQGNNRVGGLIGEDTSGTLVVDCHAKVNVTGMGEFIGGLVGISRSTIRRCYSDGSISGSSRVGGLIGGKLNTLSQSYSIGTVTGTGGSIGGLVGVNYKSISNCYSKGLVSGGGTVGGLVGLNYMSGSVITKCYSTGAVSGTTNVGGLVGRNQSNISSCFWDMESSGQATSDGGTGKTTEEMKNRSTFTDYSWDFRCETDNGTEDIWTIPILEGTDYPRFIWQQFPTADFVCPDGVEMIDFSVLGAAWLSSPGEVNWNPVCDISDPNDNFIDERDLGVFCENWLAGL